MVGRNMSLKNPVTPPEIDPETVRLVAHRLNHYATSGTRSIIVKTPNIGFGGVSRSCLRTDGRTQMSLFATAFKLS
jgi:hypothetical protein